MSSLNVTMANYPDKLTYALQRYKQHSNNWWDKVRLEIAKRLWEGE